MSYRYFIAPKMEILPENVLDTYNGHTGCACGCGGEYAKADSRAGKTRINTINNNRSNALILCTGNEAIYEVATGINRVTRVYVTCMNPDTICAMEISEQQWHKALECTPYSAEYAWAEA